MKIRDDGKAYAADVTLQELGDFLKEHARLDAGCRYCEGRIWDIPEHAGMPIVINLPTPAHHPGGINAFYTSCAKCGNIETFLAQTVVSRLMGWD